MLFTRVLRYGLPAVAGATALTTWTGPSNDPATRQHAVQLPMLLRPLLAEGNKDKLAGAPRQQPAKQVMNSAGSLVQEALDGWLQSNANVSRLPFSDGQVLVRNDWDRASTKQVALISGGGSGHEPAHAGYIGQGMLTGVVAGAVFASPSANAVLSAIRHVARPGGPGVLLIVKNYTGDRLNFGIAAEQARSEGIDVAMVVVADDCALPQGKGITGGRGVAGTVFVHKLAGAAAQQGLPLEAVVEVAKSAADSVRSMGVALSSCTIPGQPKNDRLKEHELELGLGIHGEPGYLKAPMLSADELVDRVVKHIASSRLPDHDTLPLHKGDNVAVLVNNLGSCSPLELGVVTRRAVQILENEMGVHAKAVLQGPFMTSLDMHGFSISLLKLHSAQDLTRLHALTAAPAWPKSALPRSSGSAAPPLVLPSPTPAPPPRTTRTASEQLSTQGHKLRNALGSVAMALLEAEPTLTEIDRAVGDGDCGFTFAAGAQQVLGLLSSDALACNDPILLTQQLAKLCSQAMGGTSGALYTIFFSAMHAQLRRSGKAADALTGQDIAAAVQAGVSALSRYGGAAPGHRTMLDSMVPFADSLSATAKQGPLTEQALSAAVQAAEKGAAATQGMEAVAGRSNYVPRDTLRAHPDPGAVAAAIWLRAAFTGWTLPVAAETGRAGTHTARTAARL
eukprot:g37528.t1